MKKWKRALSFLLILVMMLTSVQLWDLAPASVAEAAEKVYKIYPTPHKVSYGSGMLRPGEKANTIVESGIDSVTENKMLEVLASNRIEAEKSGSLSGDMTNVLVGIYGSGGVADRFVRDIEGVTKEHFDKIDAYVLAVTSKGIAIVGKDTDAVFYGLATLQMIFDQADGRDVRKMTILDYSDTYYRGFIEGYYGIPWSNQNRIDLMEFGGMIKSNVYVFAPKDDPYHNSQWREPYPEAKLKEIQKMVAVGAANKCRFVWSIHPFMSNGVTEGNYTESLEIIKTKFEQLYKIGVRQFGVLADDAGSISNELIVRLMNDLNQWRKEKGNVYEFLFCPPAYNWAFAGYTWSDLQALNEMDEDVNFFWTGQGVCGHVTNETVTNFGQNVGREPLFWLNWPVNDINSRRMLMGKGEVLNTDVTGLRGVITNPMQQSEPSKVAIFAVSDYAWNIKGYQADKSWADSFQYIEPDASNALYTMAKHLSDPSPNGHGLTLGESEELKPKLEAFTTAYQNGTGILEPGEDLIAEFETIVAAANTFEARSDNTEMINQLSPWTDSLRLLSEAAVNYIRTAIAIEEGKDEEVWAYYSQAASSFDASKKCPVQNKDAIQNVQAGSKRLIPFVTQLAEDLSVKVNEIVNPEAGVFEPVSPVTLIKSGIKSVYSGEEKFATDQDESTSVWYVTEPNDSMPAGGYFGIDLGKTMKIDKIQILQGGATTGADDYIPNAALEYSADGETYTELGTYQNQKDIELDVSKQGVLARYVRLRAVAATGKWFAIREFAVSGSEDEVPIQNVAYTNVAALSRREVQSTSDSAVLESLGREVTLKTGQYVGIALPRIRELVGIHTEGTNLEGLTLETSLNGVEWSTVQAGELSESIDARYVRLMNKTSAEITFALDSMRLYSSEIQKPHLTETNIAQSAVANADNGFDGDLTTQASFQTGQQKGQYMIYDLGQDILINKLKFIITDGYVDFIRAGEISVSADGETWSDPVIVIGQDIDPETAQLSDLYDNEVPYYTRSSADQLGITARYVKITITKDYTKRWTRFQEIEINDGAYLPVENNPTYVTDTVEAKGHQPSNLMDGDVSTTYVSSEADQAGTFTYRVSENTNINSITVLQNPGTVSNAAVSVRNAEGWQEIGELSHSLNVFENLSYGDIFEIRFAWESTAPMLHEMYLARGEQEPVDPVDKTALEAKYQEALEIDGKYYEEASYGVLKVAVLDAEGVLGYKAATEEDVAAVLETLNQALNGLKELPLDPSYLINKIEEARGLDATLFTEESYQVLTEALEAAEALLGDPETKQKDLDDQLAILEDAILSLVIKGTVQKIDQSELTATAGSEEGSGTDGDASAAIDNDESTYWHSNWSGSASVKPDIPNNVRNEFTIDLGKERILRKLEYVPRAANSKNGRILGYKLYYSQTASGDDFVEVPKGEGTWEDNQNKKAAEFPTVTARRFQIRATATAGDTADAFISAAEFYLYEVIRDEPVKLEYTVIFDAAGGSVSPENVKALEGEAIGTLPVPVKDGYEFLGWFTEAAGGNKVSETTAVSGNMTVYAHWKEIVAEPKEYTVTFNAAGGSVSLSSVKVKEGQTVGTLPVPVRNGYEFLGWFTAENGGIQVNAATKITGNITVYAQWKQNVPKPPAEEVKAPGKVTGLTASAQKPKQMKLSWKKEDEAAGYYIYRYDSKKKSWIKIQTTTATSFVCKGLKAYSTYQFRVTAYSRDGQEIREGQPSDTLKAGTAPVKPAFRSLKRLTTRKVKLTWKRDKKVNGYEIWMKAGKGKYRKIAVKARKVTSMTKKLKKNQTCKFRIRSFRKAGGKKVFSPFSRERKIKMR